MSEIQKMTLRFTAALFYLSIVLLLAVTAARVGLSQRAVEVALNSSTTPSEAEMAARQALDFDPANPDAYKSLGMIRHIRGDFSDAAMSFEQALNYRPNDYRLWLRRGYSLSKINEWVQAETAFQNAARLAPQYAEPQIQLGRLYLKSKNFEKAFQHLRHAAARDESYRRELLRHARRTYSNDPETMINAVGPATIKEWKTTASYFIRHYIDGAQIKDFLSGPALDEAEKEMFIAELIEHDNFPLAAAIQASKKIAGSGSSEQRLPVNGDFENKIKFDERGFGWRPATLPNVALTLEENGVFQGTRALRITFNGHSDPGVSIVSQVIPVEPDQLYRLSFSARTESLITGGPPYVIITDFAEENLIARSSAVPVPESGWQTYSLDFKTNKDVKGILVHVRRVSCRSKLCPAFGDLLIDDFELKKV